MNSSIAFKNYPYREDIDGIRALAILAVLGFHAFPKVISGGFIGVDVFFVISGYLITGIIMRNLSNQTFSFSDFYFRRLKRIFPSVIVVMMTSLLLGWILLFEKELSQLGRHARYGVSFMSNFLLWKESGYFDTSSELKPFLHLWSLCVEEQFYIIWPLILFIVVKFKINFFKIIFLIIGVSFILNLTNITKDPIGTFYLPATRFWEILTGGLLYQYSYKDFFQNKLIQSFVSFLGLMIVCACSFYLTKANVYPSWLAIIPVLGSSLMIVAGSESWPNKAIFSKKIFRWFGHISFPLYLWHWPLFAFARIVYGPDLSVFLSFILIVVSILLSWITFRFIENPIRLGTIIFDKYKLLISIILMFGIGLSGLLFEKKFLKARSTKNNEKFQLAIDDWKYPGDNFEVINFRDRIIYQIKSKSLKKTLYMGDSNIEQYAMRINNLVISNPNSTNSALFFTAPGCLPIRNVQENKKPACTEYADNVIEFANNSDVDTVVIGSLWFQYFDGSLEYQYNDSGKLLRLGKKSLGTRKALDSLKDMILLFRNKGKKVFVVSSIPMGKAIDPKNMIIRFPFLENKMGKLGMELDGLTKSNQEIIEQLKMISKKTGAIFINPLTFLCDKNFCPALTNDGYPIYKDEGHIRTSYVKENVFYLDETISQR
jgi:peptidoglycan/LPS O-acetylase OafA/YrhL